MSIDTSYDTDLALDLPQLVRVRTAVKGQHYVKLGGVDFLPDPSSKNGQPTAKYDAYKQRAEFDDYTARTGASLIGKLDANKLNADLDSELEYLLGNADGDGLSLAGYAENVFSENLIAKYCVGIVHHGGLMSVDNSELSADDVDKMSLKPQLKLYARESIVKRSFRMINGRKQLAMIMFYECSEEMDETTLSKTKVESYLVCALDENGDYYQQKIIKGSESGGGEGERNYITINNQPVKMIPAYIFSDSEVQSELPTGFGFLTPIAEICYFLYMQSADKKQAMFNSIPTINAYGFDDHNLEIFLRVNNGGYRIGDNNMMPDGTKVENTSASTDFTFYENYEKGMIEKARAFGAVIPDSGNQNDMTATEKLINSGEQSDMLLPLVDNVERGLKWLIAYCGMFLGVYGEEQLEQAANDINLTLNREFVKAKPDPQLIQVMLDLVDRQMMRKESVLSYLISVDLESGKIAEIMQELENQAPLLIPSEPQQEQDTGD